MAFRKALYYPGIDFKDEGFLKNAMLYWDKIYTIVPESIEQPYSSESALEFHSEGLLIPYVVNPDMSVVKDLTEDVLRYINSSEGEHVLRLHRSNKKLREDISTARLHPNKMSDRIKRLLESDMFYKDEGEFYRTGKNFANYYMTLLATGVSEDISAGLLTDTAVYKRLAGVARRGVAPTPTSRQEAESYSHGTLMNIVLQNFRIQKDTDAKKILRFRDRNKDELENFRREIDRLAFILGRDEPYEAIRRRAEDIYTQDISRSIDNFKRDLRGDGICLAAEGGFEITALSITTLGLLPETAADPISLVVSAGMIMTANLVRFLLSKRNRIRDNPYAYLMKARNIFG